MGHWRAGEALRLSCQQNYPHIEVEHIDIAKYFNFFAYIYIIVGYNIFSALFPSIYKIIYHQTDNAFTKKIFKIIGPILAISSRRLFVYIRSYKPDFILSTHFLPDIIFPSSFSIPHYTVITDYHAHAVWLSPETTGLFVASTEIVSELQRSNINSIASGMPIDPVFFKHKDILPIKQGLGINNEWQTVLIMPLFSHYTVLKSIISRLQSKNPQLNIIVVPGKNKHIKRHANSLCAPSIYITPDNVKTDEIMRCADVIVSKAGGLTISEALYLQKPLVLACSIPGQEDSNTDYFVKNNFAATGNTSDEIVTQIQLLLDHPEKITKKSCANANKIILERILKTANTDN